MANTYSDEYLVSMDGDINYRYSLTIEKKNQQSDTTLFVLMKNPSDGDTEYMDPTTGLLLKYAFANYHKMILVNISPVIGTDEELKELEEPTIRTVAEKNRQKIFDLISKNEGADLLVATGDMDNDDDAAELKEAYVDLMNHFADRKLFQHVYTAGQPTSNGHGHQPIGAGGANLKNMTPVQQENAQWHLKATEQ